MRTLTALFFSFFVTSLVFAQEPIPQGDPNPSFWGIGFKLVDATDGETPEPGLTISGSECQISIAGGDFANCTGTIDEIGLGYYEYEPAAADIATPGLLVLRIAESAAREEAAKARVIPTADGTAQAASSTTIQLAAAETYQDDALNGSTITIVSGTNGVGQTGCVTDYVSSTDTATVAWNITPTGTIRYRVNRTANCQGNANVLTIEGTDATDQLATSAASGAGTALTSYDPPTNAEMVARTLVAASYFDSSTDTVTLASSQTFNNTGTWTGNVTGNLSGSVGSVTGNVGGNVTGSIGSLATQAKADVNAEADSAIETYHLDHLFANTYDPASKPGAADALLNELIESDGGVSRYTANALEQAPAGEGGGGSFDCGDYFACEWPAAPDLGTIGEGVKIAPIRQ